MNKKIPHFWRLFGASKTAKTGKNGTFFYKYKVSTNFLQEITA